jgi:spore coat protein A
MMGLAGFFIVRDDVEAGLGLPAGEHEIPLVIQDRTFTYDGERHRIAYPETWQDHFYGDTVLVNGKVWPYLDVERGAYRLRILNGSNSRMYALALDSGQTFTQIGTDGGLLAAPVELAELMLAPGERADVVVDFSALAPGAEVLLTNAAEHTGAPVIPDVMKFRVQSVSGPAPAVPGALAEVPALPESQARHVRDFLLTKESEPCAGSMWMINGLGFDDVTEFPRLGTIEVWRFINRSGVMHPMHMHLVFFQVLDRQPFTIVGGEIVPSGPPVPPPPEEAGWKDTVKSMPFEITRVIAKFTDYEGNYPYHCHILEHEDHEMMRQFQTLPECPGDVDGDDEVGFQDLLAILSEWGPCSECAEDLTGDGAVGFGDLLVVLSGWGPCPT